MCTNIYIYIYVYLAARAYVEKAKWNADQKNLYNSIL